MKLVSGLVLLGVGLAEAAAGGDAALERCAAISGATERLACYDGLACAALSGADERLACYDALARKSKPAAAAAQAAPHEERAEQASAFGTLKPKPKAAPKPQGPDQLTAVVTEVKFDHSGNVFVSLDNGQLWTFKDAEALLRHGEVVTIHRAALGSYLMTTSDRHTYRVQRTQ
jgi:hypothetical protein